MSLSHIGARYILSFVCREMQRRFHSALESLFMAPAALPIREVISSSIEPSAETIEPRYVNEVWMGVLLLHTVVS